MSWLQVVLRLEYTKLLHVYIACWVHFEHTRRLDTTMCRIIHRNNKWLKPNTLIKFSGSKMKKKRKKTEWAYLVDYCYTRIPDNRAFISTSFSVSSFAGDLFDSIREVGSADFFANSAAAAFATWVNGLNSPVVAVDVVGGVRSGLGVVNGRPGATGGKPACSRPCCRYCSRSRA